MSAVRELGDAGAPRQELSPTRPQARHHVASVAEHEAQPRAAEPLRDVPAVDEKQLEQSPLPDVPHGECTGVEAVDDGTAHVEDDDHADSQPHPDAADTEGARRQE
jgi:hypothetical protein